MLEGLLKGLKLYEQAHIKIIIAIMYAPCWIFKMILPFSVRFIFYIKKHEYLAILLSFIASQDFGVQARSFFVVLKILKVSLKNFCAPLSVFLIFSSNENFAIAICKIIFPNFMGSTFISVLVHCYIYSLAYHCRSFNRKKSSSQSSNKSKDIKISHFLYIF